MPWPDNTREFQALVKRRAAVVSRGLILQEDVLKYVGLQRSSTNGHPETSLREARARFERDYISRVLQRTNLYRKLKRLGIDLKQESEMHANVAFVNEVVACRIQNPEICRQMA